MSHLNSKLTVIIGALLLSASYSSLSFASGGCGPYAHRNAFGACIANGYGWYGGHGYYNRGWYGHGYRAGYWHGKGWGHGYGYRGYHGYHGYHGGHRR